MENVVLNNTFKAFALWKEFWTEDLIDEIIENNYDFYADYDHNKHRCDEEDLENILDTFYDIYEKVQYLIRANNDFYSLICTDGHQTLKNFLFDISEKWYGRYTDSMFEYIQGFPNATSFYHYVLDNEVKDLYDYIDWRKVQDDECDAYNFTARAERRNPYVHYDGGIVIYIP